MKYLVIRNVVYLKVISSFETMFSKAVCGRGVRKSFMWETVNNATYKLKKRAYNIYDNILASTLYKQILRPLQLFLEALHEKEKLFMINKKSYFSNNVLKSLLNTFGIMLCVYSTKL